MSKNKSRFDNKGPVTQTEKVVTSPVKTETQNEESETLSLNLQPYLVPIAIVVNAIIIAVAILLAGRGGTTTTNPTTTGTVPTVTVAAGAETGEDVLSTTTIADSPYLGDRNQAKVAIVEFSDYECPFCKRHHQQVYPEIIKNYVDTGKAIYVYRNFIAVPSHNPAATTEAYAALCIKELSGGDNGKYFQYADLLYNNSGTNGQGITGGKTIYTLASEIGMNADQVKTCVESAKYADIMTRDEQAASAAQVQGTPGFVVGVLGADGSVNGKIIAGAYPFTEFQRVIEEMLAK